MAIDIEAPGANETALRLAIRQLALRAHSGACAYPTTPTSRNYTGGLIVQFGSERWDNGGWHDSGANTRMTVPAGVTKVDMEFHADADDVANMTGITGLFYKNGSIITAPQFRHDYVSWSGTQWSALYHMFDVACTAGDYFEVLFYITSGDTAITLTAKSYFKIRATAFV